MGLETFTLINSLNANNPVGASDPKSQGDDHLRGIKTTILATFPNITGVVTPTHTQLNYSADLTGVTGTGNMVRSAGPTLTGTTTAATINATTLTGAGSGITALNASNLASGTVPDARFPGTLPAASGANLTALNASNVSSGTLDDARLPGSMSGKTFTGAVAIAYAAASSAVLQVLGSALSAAQDISIFVGKAMSSGNSGGMAWNNNSGSPFLSLTTFANTSPIQIQGSSVNLNPTNAASYKNREIGYRAGEANTPSAGYTFVNDDRGRAVAAATSGTYTLNNSVFNPSDMITFVNTTGGNCTIAAGSGVTIRKAGQPGVTGNITVSDFGICNIYCQAANVFLCGGPGCT